MAPPPPHTHSTPRRRKRDNLTSDSGDDSDSDYNPRKSNHKPKPKPKSFTPAAREQSIVKTSISLPLQPSDPYSDMTDGDGEERAPEALQLPTPPKISLFSKFGKKTKSGSQKTTPSSNQGSQSGRSPQSASSFTSPPVPPSPASTFTPVSVLRSSKPIPVTNLLATHQTRSATGSLPFAVVPNSIEPSLPSLDSSDFFADLLGPATSPQNPFRAATKSGILERGNQPGPSTTTTGPPPVKPSGIKLRFNFKAKKAAAKSISFQDTPSVVPSPDTSGQESKSSYTPLVFGSGNSSSISRARYQSSPPGFHRSSGSTQSSPQGSLCSLSTPSKSQQSQGRIGSFGSAASREPTLEDQLLSALQAELGSDLGESDIDVPLLEGIVNRNIDSKDSDSGSDCEIDADILAEVEAEEAEMNNDNEVEVVQTEWQPSPDLSSALYSSDNQELIQTSEKLCWLLMQAQWAEHGGVKNGFLTGLESEILHLEGVKLRLEQKLSSIPNLGGVVNGAANDVDSGQAALQVKQEKPFPPTVPRIAPNFLYDSRNGELIERRRKKVNAQAPRLNGRKSIAPAKRGDAAAAALGEPISDLGGREGQRVRGTLPVRPPNQIAVPLNPFRKNGGGGRR